MKKNQSLISPSRVTAPLISIILTAATLLPFFLVTSAGPSPKPDAASSLRIMAWGDLSPQWQRTLHVSGLRTGCSGEPQSCVKYVSSLNPALNVFLAVLLKPETVDYGEKYSALSLQHPNLVEIGVDDFGSQYWKLLKANGTDPRAVLGSFIDGVKSRNPNLKFGATIYEDDLGTEYLGDKDLPPALRAKFDNIHFFMHYRANTPKYEDDVQQLKALFPKAQIIGGVYSYDRISYVPCQPKGQPCTVDQEMNYFNQNLEAATKLLKQGTISWIELFPAIFGREGDWQDWSSPRLCPGRLPECVSNTQKMDQVVVAKIKQLLG